MDNPDARKIIDDYSRFGQEIPESLIPPELSDVELYYWWAFWDLCTERQSGMTPGPIPGSVIRQYAIHETGLNPSAFSKIIRAMDDAYLSHQTGETKTFSREMIKR